MVTRLGSEHLIHEHLRDLQREARTAAFHATQREWLAERAPRPANEEAPWMRAAFPSPRGQIHLALDC